MAYKYSTTSRSDGTYIEYDIAPDLCASGAFIAGDTITITGVVHNRYGKFTGLSLNLQGTSIVQTAASISFSSAKGSDKSFSFSFSAPNLSSSIGSARSIALSLQFELPATITSGGTTGHTTITLSTSNKITYIKYRLEPNIVDFRLERCNSSGAASNEGTYLRCAMLKLSKSSKASASDFSVCKFTYEAAGGTSSSSFSATGPFSTALTSAGYKETGSPSANLFGTRQFSTTTDYNVTITVGDAYDTCSATVVVPRAFAIMHFSGAAKGGVAIGMFSSATDQQPKFEVAENHQSIFYGPVEFRGDVSGGGGGIAGFTTVTLENTGSSAKAVSGTIPSISGATKYICTGVLGWNVDGRPGVNSTPTVSGNTLTATLAAHGTVMFGILGVR